jgi:hypothetical protein
MEMIRDLDSPSNKHKSKNNWMHYEKGVYEAQQQCRKFHTGEKYWSPKTALLGVRVLL